MRGNVCREEACRTTRPEFKSRCVGGEEEVIRNGGIDRLVLGVWEV